MSIINRILNYFGYYKPTQLVVGNGHCGCCEKPINNSIFIDKSYMWGLCEECRKDIK